MSSSNAPRRDGADRAVPARALWLLALLTLVWGTNWPLFTFAVQEVSVWTFRAFALPVAGLTMLAVARMRGMSLRVAREDRPTLLGASMAYLVVWNICSTYAAVMLPSGQAAILGFTMPLWAAMIGAGFLGQRLSRRLVVALCFGAAAVGLLMWRSLWAYADAPVGFALGIASAVGWAVGTLLLKRKPPGAHVLVATGWQLMAAGVPILLVALVMGEGLNPQRWFWPSWSSMLAIAYITWMPMTVGNLAWFSIVGLLPAQVAGLSSIMVPMVAMVSGALIHREPLGPTQLLAMACSGMAMWLALSAPRRASA